MRKMLIYMSDELGGVDDIGVADVELDHEPTEKDVREILTEESVGCPSRVVDYIVANRLYFWYSITTKADYMLRRDYETK